MDRSIMENLFQQVKEDIWEPVVSAATSHLDHTKEKCQQLGLSAAASHLDLSNEHRVLNYYYDNISEKPINAGRFKQIYSARHKASGEMRSIKMLPKKMVSKEFFWKEVELYKELCHPNVLHCYETLEDRNYYYLVRDRFDVPNLYQAIPKMFPNSRDFQEPQVATVIRTLLKTLDYCHKQGVVHSDLSYECILLDPSTKDLTNLTIAGFGLARLLREYRVYHHHLNHSDHSCGKKDTKENNSRNNSDTRGKKHTKKTATATKEGAVAREDLFAAPETRWGDLSMFENEADVWSVGIIAYQLLSRKHPFADPAIIPVRFQDEDWKRHHFESAPHLKHVSPLAKDFLSHLLVYQHYDRPSAAKALEHEWIAVATKRAKRSDCTEDALLGCLENLQHFDAETKLAQCARLYIANNLLTQEERVTLDRVFASLDRDKSNEITREELAVAFQKTHWGNKNAVMVQNLLQQTFDRVDMKKNGRIGYAEFLAAAADDSVLLTREKLRATFDAFDKSHTGTINYDDLMHLFNDGRKFTILGKMEAKNFLRQVDLDGDGEIDFDEFCALLRADI